MEKPVGPKNIRIGRECSSLERTLVSYILGISLFILLLSPIFLSCIKVRPKSHEEWAAQCIGKDSNAEFQKCLDDWKKWELENN